MDAGMRVGWSAGERRRGAASFISFCTNAVRRMAGYVYAKHCWRRRRDGAKKDHFSEKSDPGGAVARISREDARRKQGGVHRDTPRS